jgi:hypothetical protein
MSSSYASILKSKPAQPTAQIQVVVSAPRLPSGNLKDDVQAILTRLAEVPAPESLRTLITGLRNEMETLPQPNANRFASSSRPQTSGGGGGSGFSIGNNRGDRERDRSDRGERAQLAQGWRNGNRFSSVVVNSPSSQSLNSMGSGSPRTPLTPSSSTANVGRYQSKFVSASKDMDDKILNTVIGNKLNAFTALTYEDTRDFIYQIMDSGETEFIKDFVEKVFGKATSEDLYCALFAKLLAEIANRYPVMYEEMNRYHNEFVKIFENVQEDKDTDYATLVKQKQYRMGYGLFLAELASSNALEKAQLFTMVSIVISKLDQCTKEETKTKTVEEYIDCLIRLTKSLKERSPKYFEGVREDLGNRILSIIGPMIQKTAGPRPSLTSKARFGLMDLKDILTA